MVIKGCQAEQTLDEAKVLLAKDSSLPFLGRWVYLWVKWIQTDRANTTAAKCLPIPAQLLSARKRGRLRSKQWEQSCGARATSGTVLGQNVKGNHKGTADQEGRAGAAGNWSCGWETKGCKKMYVGCLERNPDVVMGRKIHSGVYQAAVTLVPLLSEALKLKLYLQERDKKRELQLSVKKQFLVASICWYMSFQRDFLAHFCDSWALSVPSCASFWKSQPTLNSRLRYLRMQCFVVHFQAACIGKGKWPTSPCPFTD